MTRAVRDPQQTSLWTRIRRPAALALVLLIGAAGSAGAASVELISRANPVPDTFWDSAYPAFSSDGRYVLFGSYAPNLVPGQIDGNNYSDLFLHDRVTGTTTLVSHQAGSPLATDPAGASTFDAVLSADSRYAVYSSPGTHLVAGTTDTNQGNDVFLWDRVTGTTTLVSHAAGAPNMAADGVSGRARISADGEWVVFTSYAKNLVPGQTEPAVLPGTVQATEDVFLWHRSTGTVTLVSHKSGAPAATAAGSSSQPGISADGSSVVFMSDATDLLFGIPDTNSRHDVFVYERSSGSVSLVSRASGGSGTGNGLGSWEPRISADGRFIAFASLSGNLVPGQVGNGLGLPDAFLFDRVTGEMRLASHKSSSPLAGAGIAQYLGLALSADGSALAFVSQAHNLVPGQVDTNGAPDVFVYDRLSGSIELASHAPGSPATAAGEPAQAAYPSVSADGRFVAFTSDAQDLDSGEPDAPGAEDVFLYDRSDKSVVLVSRGSVSSPTDEIGSISTVPTISLDGSAIAFSSTMAGLGGAFDPHGFSDVFVYSRSSADIAVLSRRDPANPAAVTPHGPSTLGAISADGQTILFVSEATSLVPGQIDSPYQFDPFGFVRGTPDAFLVDRAAGRTILLSRSPSSPLETTGILNQPVLSADGRFAAFTATVSPVPPFTSGTALQLYDKVTDTAILVNHKPGAPAELAPGYPAELAISADGRYLAYSCNSCSTLVPGQQSGNPGTQIDLFLYDRVTRINTLVSHTSFSPVTGGNRVSWSPVISADGRFVAFQSEATNLVAGQSDFPSSQDIFVFDRTTGGIALVSRSASSAAMTGNQPSRSPVISADGRFIAFLSHATDIVPGQADTNSTVDVFLWDRITGTTELVSHLSSSPTTAGNVGSNLTFLASTGSFSADGRFLVYESHAIDLVSGGVDTNDSPDVFLYDLATKSNTLVSHALGAPGTAGNKGSTKARISADGRRIGFVSPATDLVAGQAPNGASSLILQDRITGARTLVGRVSSFPPTTNDSFLFPRMSADGRFVAFTSDSPGFVAGDLNANWDVFLYREGANGPVTVPPCTLFDTRRPADGPALRSGTRKILTVHGACGVPATATAAVVKVTVPQPRRRGNLRLTPGDAATPAATLRFPRRQTRTGSFTVPLAANGTLALQATVVGNGAVHAVVEVVGYVE